MNRLSIVATQARIAGVSAAVQRRKNSQPLAGGAPAPERAAHASFSFGDVAVYSPAGQTVIQAKLTVGPVDDAYEREADHVAAQVVAGLDAPPVQRQAAPGEEEEEVRPKLAISALQRQPAPEEEDETLRMKSTVQRQVEGGGEAGPSLEAAIHRQRGGGEALLPATRHSMEQAIGADFSRVRVHSDAQSDRLSRAIQARAFTTGADIFMRQGEYRPQERSGQELLAHELTHVVQQGSANASGARIGRMLQRAAIPLFANDDLAETDGIVYRRGNSFAPKLNEYRMWKRKVGKDRYADTDRVAPTHGVSVHKSLEGQRRAAGSQGVYEIETLPASLRVKQRGQDSEHYEVVPVRFAANYAELPTVAQYEAALSQITVKKV